MGEQSGKAVAKSVKSAAQTMPYDQLLVRVHVLEEGMRLALDHSMMPRELVARLMALLPDGDMEAINSTTTEYRED